LQIKKNIILTKCIKKKLTKRDAKGFIVYNELEAELQQAFNASPYLLNKLLPKLKSKVFKPRLNNANIPILPKNIVLAPLTSSLGGTNHKFNLHAEKHS
jgi:hypothetical protein